MSLQDIKANYEIINIAGVDYKISFDYKALADIEEYFKCGIYELLDKINKGEFTSIQDRMQVTFVGLKKYQPGIGFDVLSLVENMLICWDKTQLALMQPLISPAIYAKIKQDTDDIEKKMQEEMKAPKTPKTRELTGESITISQSLS